METIHSNLCLIVRKKIATFEKFIKKIIRINVKNVQKLILPLLILTLIGLVYFLYFSPKEGLGSFDDFDPNNNAVKDIRVKIVQNQGINKTPEGGAVFFAEDKNNTVVQVNADKVPQGLESAGTIILKGHLSQGGFHAHDVVID